MSRPSIVATSREPVGVGDRAGVDAAAVAQHGDLLAEPEDLVELVASRRAPRRRARAAASITLEQPVDLARLERRRRLVHDHDPRVGRDSARAIATICWTPSAELAERPPDVDVDAVAAPAVSRAVAVHRGEVDEAEPVRRFAAQEQVAGDAASCGTRLISW